MTKLVYKCVLIRDLTPEDCANILEAHHTWSRKSGTTVFAVKHSETHTEIFFSDSSSLLFPVEFARKTLKIIGVGECSVSKKISDRINQPETYN